VRAFAGIGVGSLVRGEGAQIKSDLRALIRRMSTENPLWGAPRIPGELLKLGFEVAQSSVANYMVKRSGPPSQGWGTFMRNHAPDIAAMDLFVVPTISFNLLYAVLSENSIRWRFCQATFPCYSGNNSLLAPEGSLFGCVGIWV
jgi:hypothetical protein